MEKKPNKYIAPVLECTGELMPNVPNMTEFFKSLGSIPAVMSLQLAELPACIAMALWDDIKSIVIQPLDAMEDFLGALSPTLPSQTKNTVRDRPEEWKRRADDLQENYKLYFQLALINLLGSFASHILKIPLPLVSGCYVGDLLSPEGRQRIRDAVIKNFANLIELIPEPFRSLCKGEFGYFSLEEAFRNFFSYWKSMVKKIISNPLFAVFQFLIKKFNKIWKSLNLPALPALLSLDPSEIIMAIVQPYIATIQNTYNALIKPFKDIKEGIEKYGSASDYLKSELNKILPKIVNSILSIKIPVLNVTIGDLMGIKSIEDLADGVVIRAQDVFARLIARIANVFEDIVLIILEQWIQKVKKFLDKIGLGVIFTLVPLTFCKFLKIIAAPLFNIGKIVESAVNSAAQKAQQLEKLRKDIEILNQNPELNKAKIAALRAQMSSILPAAALC